MVKIMQYDPKIILIAEDNVQEQQILQNTIQKISTNMQFYFSKTMEDALQVAYELVIDIFILDIELADDSSGIALAKRIRKIPKYFDTPIIFATVYGDKEVKVFRELRCQTFIIKPLERDKIEKAYLIATKSINFHRQKRNNIQDNNKLSLRLTHKGTTHVYLLNEIVFIKSDGNYILIASHDLEKSKLEISTKRESLKNIALKLDKMDEGNFVRCHKCFIINMRYINQIDWFNRNLKLRFISNDNLYKMGLGKPGRPVIIPLGKEFKVNFQTEEI
jgi:two-component system LytT family response regulator